MTDAPLEESNNNTQERNYGCGDSYKGQFINGKKEGEGIYNYKNGDIYNGNWKNDNKEGEGKYNYKNGDIYI